MGLPGRVLEPLDDRRSLALVFAVTCLAYGAALLGTFVFDDLHSVRDNPAIRSLANIPAFFTDVEMFSSLQNHMYRPLLLVTFALNHAIAGLQSWSFKLTDVLLHATNACLLLSIARRMGAARWPALFGAALFGVHPLASEAVNMVSGRSDVLVTCGILVAIRCQLSAMAGSRGAPAGIVGGAVLACGSKVTGVVLPACLLVLEAVRHRDTGWSWRGAALRVGPALAVAMAYLLVRRALLGAATVTLPPVTGGTDLLVGGARDLVTHWATMCVLLPRTLVQVLVPAGLSLDPEVRFMRTFLDLHVLCGAALLVLLTWLGVRAPRRRPLCLLGTVLAWSTSLPWIVIPLNVPLSEHRLYGMLAGLAMVVAGAIPDRVWSAGRRPLVAVAAVAVLGLLAGARSLDYRHERLLWTKVLALNPDSVRGLCGMALVHLADGDIAAARSLVSRAVGIHPAHISARRNVAETNLMLGEHGDPFTALVMADYLVAHAPGNPFHRLLLSRACVAAGDRTGERRLYLEAEQAALSCLEIAEPKGLVFRTAAHARYRLGDLEGAIAHLDESVRRGLDHVSVLVHRSELLLEAGRAREADADLRRAMAQDPLDPMVQAAVRRRAGARPGR